MHNNRFAGIALIVLGAVFLLPQITGVGFPLWQWWPLLPMAAGLVSLSGGNRRGGLILIAIFSVFLLHNLGVLNIDFSSLWPIALIVMGVAISLGRWSFGARSVSDAGEELNAASLFSGSNQFAGGKGFRGGNVSATFGSADIDLRAADLVEGVASVNASALFGSINLLGVCPRNNVLNDMRHWWSVKMLITPLQSPECCKQVIVWRFSSPGTNTRTGS